MITLSPQLRSILIKAAVVIALVGGAYAFGRFAQPAKVEEKTVTVEKTVVVTQVDDKKLEQLSEQVKQALSRLEQLKKSIHKEKTSTTFPDGRIEAKETVDINIEKTVQTTEVKEVEKQVVVVQEKIVVQKVDVEKIVEKDKIVTAGKSNWRLTPMVGVDVPQLFTGKLVPVYGGAIQGRIANTPISGGIWGLGSVVGGSAGLSLSIDLP